MVYIENIVIGTPIASEEAMFALDKNDWENVEKEKTYWTDERNLAVILKEIGVVASISEVRRNKPQYVISLDKPNFIEVKWGKRKLFVLVGE